MPSSHLYISVIKGHRSDKHCAHGKAQITCSFADFGNLTELSSRQPLEKDTDSDETQKSRRGTKRVVRIVESRDSPLNCLTQRDKAKDQSVFFGERVTWTMLDSVISKSVDWMIDAG